MTKRQVFDYVALALIWGASFVLLLRVVAAFGWIGATTFRAFIASALLLVLARLSKKVLQFPSAKPLLIVGATTVAGQLVGLSFSTPRIGTAMAAIIVATIPLFSMVIGQMWGIEHITTLGKVGLLLGFVGIVLLVGFPAVPFTPMFWLGVTASLLSAISAAIGSNYARRHLQHVGSWEQTIGAFFFGGLLSLPLIVVVPVTRTPTFSDVLWLIALAGLCSSLTYVLYFRLVAELGATVAISVEFLVTVVAVFIGAVFLGESLTAVQVMGGLTIIGGCAMVLGLVGSSPARQQQRS